MLFIGLKKPIWDYHTRKTPKRISEIYRAKRGSNRRTKGLAE